MGSPLALCHGRMVIDKVVTSPHVRHRYLPKRQLVSLSHKGIAASPVGAKAMDPAHRFSLQYSVQGPKRSESDGMSLTAGIPDPQASGPGWLPERHLCTSKFKLSNRPKSRRRTSLLASSVGRWFCCSKFKEGRERGDCSQLRNTA